MNAIMIAPSCCLPGCDRPRLVYPSAVQTRCHQHKSQYEQTAWRRRHPVLLMPPVDGAAFVQWPGRREGIGHWVPLGQDDCWPYSGTPRADGYCSLAIRNPTGARTSTLAHRYVLQQVLGFQLPQGMEADHLCHNEDECAGGPSCGHRRCVRPQHLRYLPSGANVRGSYVMRSTCGQGHPRTRENTYIYRGTPRCRVCVLERIAAAREAVTR